MNKITFGVGLTVAFAVGATMTWFLQQDRFRDMKGENARLQAEVLQGSSARPAVPVQPAEVASAPIVDPDELVRLRGAKSEVLKLRGTASAGVRENERLKAELAQAKESAADPTNQLGGAMSEMMKGVLDQQMTAKLSRMKTRLNLTPDQEESIKQLYAKQSAVGLQAAQNMLGGKLSKEDFATQAKGVGNVDQQIQAMLTPEQQVAYKDYKQEELASNAKIVANAEMLQMQSVVTLSPQQQDQVAQILVDQHMKQQAPDRMAALAAGTDPMAIVQQQFDNKLKAMEGVLTPDQMASYQQFQETQMKLVQKLMGNRNPGGAPKQVVP